MCRLLRATPWPNWRTIRVTDPSNGRSRSILVAALMSHGCRVDHLRLQRHVAASHDVPDHHADIAFAALAGMRLRRLAPPAIQQNVGGLHAHGGWVLCLPHDRRKHANTFVGVRPA